MTDALINFLRMILSIGFERNKHISKGLLKAIDAFQESLSEADKKVIEDNFVLISMLLGDCFGRMKTAGMAGFAALQEDFAKAEEIGNNFDVTTINETEELVGGFFQKLQAAFKVGFADDLDSTLEGAENGETKGNATLEALFPESFGSNPSSDSDNSDDDGEDDEDETEPPVAA